MTPQEQEIAIKEIEDRVDRLRNLYEQYFLGFERLEPTVPRKDVDRRLALLRKEQIRNTAMRFRFNVVTQKYNTYAMHWVRICRQIEEGTYKRHVRRARARFGDEASLVGGADRERDISIDIDIGDFDMDIDEVLQEANTAAAKYERHAADSTPDTLPPPVSERAPISDRTMPSGHVGAAAPVSAVASASPRSAAVPSAPLASSLASERTPRPVMLPTGGKPRIVVRKKEDAEVGPGSTRTPFPGSAPDTAPAPSVGRAPVASPVSGRRVPVAGPVSAGRTPAASVGRVPAPPPLAETPVAGVPAIPPEARGPATRPQTTAASHAGHPGAPRIRVARPAGAPPASSAAAGTPPATAPGSSPSPPLAPPGSSPRQPAPAPASSPKLPPPSSPKLPLPPPSTPRVPIPPGSQPRPRTGLPLPSQGARPAPPPIKPKDGS